jgi:hypothetical protein
MDRAGTVTRGPLLLFLLSGASAVATSCHHTTRGTAATVVPADTTAVGTVRVVGAAPAEVVVLTLDGWRVALIGPLQRELATLTGARVEVQGPVQSADAQAAPRAITVRGYRILEIGGATPIVGRLETRDGEWWIDTVRLAAVPPDLARAVGRRVWVTGTPGGGGLMVQLFGIITRPPP